MNQIQSIFRELDRTNSKKLNILYHNTHEEYDTRLAATGHNFYCYNFPGVKPWNETFRTKPSNFIELNGQGLSQLLPHVPLDLVLSGNKFGAWQHLAQLARYLNLPHINVEHTASHYGPTMIEKIHSMKSTLDVFISNWSVKSWGYEDKNVKVIHHGVDTNTFVDNNLERENKILSIQNDFINRDYCLNYQQFCRVTKDLPVSIWGDTKGLSVPATSLEHLVNLYNTHRIFLNTANLSPIPSVVMEAASCGMAIVSIRACAIEEYLTDGVDCLLANNDIELRNNLELLMKDEGLAKKLGKTARENIISKFGFDKFVKQWDETFWSVVK